jgi:flagellin-like protein
LLLDLAERVAMVTIQIVVLVLPALGAVTTWPYSRNWGYAPSGIIGTLLVIMIILALSGRI